MTVNRHKYFRWTKRTAWLTFAYVVMVPAMLGTAGYMTEVSLDKHAFGWWRKRHSRRYMTGKQDLQVLTADFRASGTCAASGGAT